jgi:hypothetical protein
MVLLGIDTYFAKWVPETAEPVYARVPHEIGAWEGEDVAVSEEMLTMILGGGRSSYFERFYTNDDDDRVSAMVIYIDSPEALRHTPERCLKGAGWALDRIASTEIPLDNNGRPANANLITAVKQDARTVLLYIYVTSEGYQRTPLASLMDYSSKRLTSRDQMMGHVLLTTVIPFDESELDAVTMLSYFAAQYLPHVRETLREEMAE